MTNGIFRSQSKRLMITAIFWMTSIFSVEAGTELLLGDCLHEVNKSFVRPNPRWRGWRSKDQMTDHG